MKTYTYILCTKLQHKEAGRWIETTINMDAYKEFETFLNNLYKKGDISKEELETIESAYYG